MKRLLAFLALCLPLYLFAQGFGSFSHDQPFFAKDAVSSGSDNPTGLPNLIYHWVASDLTNSPVDSWVDRIQGAVLYNTTNRPHWDATGVRFYGTNFLKVAAPFPLVAKGYSSDNVYMIIASHNQSSAAGTFLGGTNTQSYCNILSPTTLREGLNPMGSIAANTTFDFIYNGSTNATHTTYTNGVVCFPAGYTGTVNNMLSFVGQISNNTGRLIGTIKEIMIWDYGTYAYDTNIAAMHNYATNTYGYSP